MVKSNKCKSDMENPASVQAILADICVEKFGHFAVKQELTTKLPHFGHFLNQSVDLTIDL